jgi:uncharacterized OB-fold protein
MQKIKKACPNCKEDVAWLSLDEKFCTKCGAELIKKENKGNTMCLICKETYLTVFSPAIYCKKCKVEVVPLPSCAHCGGLVFPFQKHCGSCGTSTEKLFENVSPQ